VKFIDYVKIEVKAGDGGRGCVSFRREKFIPKGGPNGGDGGRGGHIIIRTDPQLYTLLDHVYRKTYGAERGQHGMGKNMHGRDGKDLLISVPVGTVVKNSETGEVLADLDTPFAEILIAKGGRGGLGNAHFATSTRQAPRFAQPGEPGEEIKVVLELKLLADVGLIGLPNAGKSTLIAAISSARPKIAAYPFTTLKPNLGVVKTGNFQSFVVADIPGLIEGAHRGVGLGFQFLRHVERTKLLVHLVDVSEMTPGDPVDNLLKVNRELGLYSRELLERPLTVAATKTDVASEERIRRLREYCKMKDIPYFEISAMTARGVTELVSHLALEVRKLREQEEK